jgi:uncharacterized membrane protein YgaE (UPF0421/DUF939 family)
MQYQHEIDRLARRGQTARTMDAAEALTNATIGLAVSWLLTWGWLGFDPFQSAGITAVFFVASFARAWIIRGVFRAWQS